MGTADKQTPFAIRKRGTYHLRFLQRRLEVEDVGNARMVETKPNLLNVNSSLVEAVRFAVLALCGNTHTHVHWRM